MTAGTMAGSACGGLRPVEIETIEKLLDGRALPREIALADGADHLNAAARIAEIVTDVGDSLVARRQCRVDLQMQDIAVADLAGLFG